MMWSNFVWNHPTLFGLILQCINNIRKVSNILFSISGSFLGIEAGNPDRFVGVPLSCRQIQCQYVDKNYDQFLIRNSIIFSMEIAMMRAFCLTPYEPWNCGNAHVISFDESRLWYSYWDHPDDFKTFVKHNQYQHHGYVNFLKIKISHSLQNYRSDYIIPSFTKNVT